MTQQRKLGGVIHSYQRFDPTNIPSPNQPPPDLVSPAFEHLLAYGDMREFTEEELANAVRLDASQIAGLGPSLEAPAAMLEERKRKILEKYETAASRRDRRSGTTAKPARHLAAEAPGTALRAGFSRRATARAGTGLVSRGRRPLTFCSGADAADCAVGREISDRRTGRQIRIQRPRRRSSVPQAIEIKEELETIDRLLKQIAEAAKTAAAGHHRHGGAVRVRRAGRSRTACAVSKATRRTCCGRWPSSRASSGGREGFRLSPQAYRLFQGRLLGANLQRVCRPRALAGIKGRSWAKAPSNCQRPNTTSSATR